VPSQEQPAAGKLGGPAQRDPNPTKPPLCVSNGLPSPKSALNPSRTNATSSLASINPFSILSPPAEAEEDGPSAPAPSAPASAAPAAAAHPPAPARSAPSATAPAASAPAARASSPAPFASASPADPARLTGVRTSDAPALFKLAGHGPNNRNLIALLDSGASGSGFVDPAFAASCGLKLEPSDRLVQLADGTVVTAAGQVTLDFTLNTVKGPPVPFRSVFIATPLQGYHLVLGVGWLAEHDVLVGWRSRSLRINTPGRLPRQVRPIEVMEEPKSAARFATMTLKSLQRAMERKQVEELFLVQARPIEEAGEPTAAPTEEVKAASGATDPEVTKLLKEFKDVFPDQLPSGLPPGRGVEHSIQLKPDAVPPRSRPLRHESSKDLSVMQKYIQEGIESGQLRVSNSPYGAMALIVKKKDGEPRVVIDYRGLNEITVKDKYPLPLMDELFDRVHGARYFTKIDLRSGFHQIRMAEADIEKTAFRTRYGSFEYTVLPMGLCNAPSTFMRLMNETFRDMLDRCVLAFLDDILIYSRTREEHIGHVRQVLERLRKHKLYAKLSKCEWFQAEVEFLGHRIGRDGLAVSQDKVSAVQEWPAPKNVTEVRSFLGLAGFYRRFVKNFSLIARPLTELTHTDHKWEWGPEQQASMDALKAALCSAPVLIIPDPSKPFTLNCDACMYAVGATLQQDLGNGLQPVAYRSRKLTPAEVNYDTREKEFLALVDACSYWRHYLHSDLPFRLLSDHDSLKYHKTMPNLSGRLARWVEKMAEFEYTIEHIPGAKNVVADALSRRADLKVLQLAATATQTAADRERFRQAAEATLPAPPDQPAPNRDGTIMTPTQRCTASTKAGAHCKQLTAMGQYCWSHLRVIKGLRIKKSSIPRAGKGLFAARALPSGHKVPYTGDLIRLRDPSQGGAYYLELRRGLAVDAARRNAGEGRWVNDPKGSDKIANCYFSMTHPRRGQGQTVAFVRTLRPIQEGEELLVKYGAEYWRFRSGPSAKQKRRERRRPAATSSAANLVALATVAKPESELTKMIVEAAKRDPQYTAKVATPPTGITTSNGLLFDDQVLVVPDNKELRTRIISACHDEVTGAHLGRDKTLAAVKRTCTWPGLATDVERYVTTCDACQRNKPSQLATPGPLMPLPLPDKPCQEWTQDAVTGLPKTKRGHDAIQVYVERLCKLKHFAATRSTDGAKELAASFSHSVVRLHGVPTAVVSDRDPRITAHFYSELSRLMGTQLKMSTARHPQTDGQSEREIRTLITALRHFCNQNQDDWDDYLDMLELGFNSTRQSSTQFSPFELVYGQPARLPLDVAIDPLAPRAVPAAGDRMTRMRQALEFARSNLLAAQARQAASADAHRRSVSFQVGDMVMLTTEGLRLRSFNNKLCSPFIGPFPIVAVVNPNAYTLQLPPQLKCLHPTFNITKLKLYRNGVELFPSRPQPFSRPPPTAEADSNGTAEYEVESIVAQRRAGRGMQYLVQWKGYPPEDNSWMSKTQLRDAKEALAEFEAAQTGATQEEAVSWASIVAKASGG
jgi:transposase InsO family protein